MSVSSLNKLLLQTLGLSKESSAIVIERLDELEKDNSRLEKQLAIATKALEEIDNGDVVSAGGRALLALASIRKIDEDGK